jgi:hypothetical protein
MDQAENRETLHLPNEDEVKLAALREEKPQSMVRVAIKSFVPLPDAPT